MVHSISGYVCYAGYNYYEHRLSCPAFSIFRSHWLPVVFNPFFMELFIPVSKKKRHPEKIPTSRPGSESLGIYSCIMLFNSVYGISALIWLPEIQRHTITLMFRLPIENMQYKCATQQKLNCNSAAGPNIKLQI
jgi:hypothetical protein